MKRPEQLDPLAAMVLDQLAGKAEASEIILGGYFALKHYLDYRATHDVDAWWRTRSSQATETAIEAAMRAVAGGNGLSFQKRSFGDTSSFELLREKSRLFSFQIAIRSVELQPPVLSPWPPILIETLADNIGAKMNALVGRGAPRDFTDIKRVVDAGMMSVADCWKLWQGKNTAAPIDAARANVRFHLAGLETRRPLSTIASASERDRARATRSWFAQEFLRP